jgi:hypothetical protein
MLVPREHGHRSDQADGSIIIITRLSIWEYITVNLVARFTGQWYVYTATVLISRHAHLPS